MKRMKKIFSCLGTFLCICMIGCTLLMTWLPQQWMTIFPFQFYTILTDSMEPVLPVDSLVIVKQLKGEPQPGDIITFQADRFGQMITVTHYFATSEVIDDVTYYRTHANGIAEYDIYHTTYEDIKGVYVMHIPYIGRIVLFLGSPYGIFMLIFILFILLLYHYINEHFDLDENVHVIHPQFKRKHRKQEILSIHNIRVEEEGMYLVVKGEIYNDTTIPMHHIKGKLVFTNVQGEQVASRVFCLIGMQVLSVQESHQWNVRMKVQPQMENVRIDILKAKKPLRKKY